MGTPCTETADARLDRLERENARMKQFGVLLLVGTATLIVVGTDLFRTPRQVEAREFVLKNRDGRVRATLGLKEDGAPRLALFDSRGRQQVALQSMPDD